MTKEQIKCPFCNQPLDLKESERFGLWLQCNNSRCCFAGPLRHDKDQAIAAIKSIEIVKEDDSKLLPCLWCKMDEVHVGEINERTWEMACAWCYSTSMIFETKEEAIKTHNQMYRKLHGDVV